MTLDVFCVYGAPNEAHMRTIQIPALQAQVAQGMDLRLHVLNYADDRPLLADAGGAGLDVTDWSAGREPRQIGFGEAVNFLFEKSRPEGRFLLVNPDSLPVGDCITRLLARHDAERPGIVEARQWPMEHPKEYDPATGETPWASGAFLLIDSAVFGAIGGFDPVYFLYCEDVDLSWRMWLAGSRVLYEPEALCMHFTGALGYREDRFYYEHYFSSRNYIGIAYKFFGEEGESKALDHFRATGYPPDFKRRVLDDYAALKSRIIRHPGPVASPHVKILGFNRYHEFRQ